MPLPQRILTLQGMLRAKDEEMELMQMKVHTQDEAVNVLAEENNRTLVTLSRLEKEKEEAAAEIADKKKEISDLLNAVKTIEASAS